jgi:hypothetical protein
VNSGGLGGQVTGLVFSVATADRIPGATGKSVTVSFKTATSLENGNAVSITWPMQFLSGGQMGVTSGSSNFATSTNSIPNGVAITTTSAIPAGAYTVTLTGVTMGIQSNRGSSFGVTVSTSKDFASDGVASGTLGGQIADVTFTIASGYLVSGAVVDAIISFTISSPQFSTSLFITWPRNFFLSGQMRYKLSGGVDNTVYATDTFIPVATTQQQQLLPGRHSITLIGVTLGGPIGSYPSGISDSTQF